jgi:hypothetical protein
MIRILLAALALAAAATLAAPLPAAAAPLEIGKSSGDDLLALCEPALALLDVPNEPPLDPARRGDAAACIAFVDGFIWGHAWSAWRDRVDMYYCPPEGFGAREGVPALVKYLREEPGRRIQRAHLLVFAAFNRAWPCPAPPVR